MQTLVATGSVLAGRFQVEEPVSKGGMGQVYRARDLSSGSLVALKLLSVEHRADTEARFVREAKLLSQLQHPAIVKYLAHGTTPLGQLFLAMEWLEGEDLASRLLRAPLSLQETLALIKRTADALAYLHERQIVHRDVKPSNLYLPDRQPGHVKLLDLGIAQVTEPSQRLTRTGVVIGTPEYLSPEQAHGHGILLPASDLFSVGCVLYECLAGHPPFTADHVTAVLARVLFEDPAPLETRRPGLPRAVLNLVDKLLAKSPEDRIQSAQKLSETIAELGMVSAHIGHPQITGGVASGHLFGQDEQSLISVVLASQRAVQDNEVAQPSVASHALLPSERNHLLDRLAEVGIAAHFLASGDLLAKVMQSESATDLAKQAARGAQLIRSYWPEARVVMATGRGRISGHTMLGEVVARAGKLLDTAQAVVIDAGEAGVRLDTLSANLLEGHFAIRTPASGTLLLQDARDADSERLLLGRPSPFVGREAELMQLRAEWQACVEDSEARAVLVVASPGMGKSRLKREFIGQLEREHATITLLHGIGDPLTSGAPFEILRRAILRLCRLGGNEPAAEQEQRLRQRVERHVSASEQDRIFRFLAILCRLPVGDGGSPLVHAARQDPKIMRQQIGLAVDDWLLAESQAAPVLVVLDDLQWGDASTIELLELTLQAQFPLLVLGFARPGMREQFPKLWSGHKVRHMTLHELGRKACEKLVRQVLGATFDDAALQRAIDHSTGNALFLEEQIRALAAQHGEDRPETILAMMQARIGWQDAAVRRVIRAAAIFGTTFWTGGLALLLDQRKDAPELLRCLRELLEKEFIVVRRTSRYVGEPEYVFRHPLVWEAAYSLLTEEDLRLGHQRAAQFLERMGEQDAILIADHTRQGGDAARAIPYYCTAATQAYERNDLPETLRRVDRGEAAGAQGEDLGLLQALRCLAAFWTGSLAISIPAGLRALDLLPDGTKLWCSVIGNLFISVAQEPAGERLMQLIERFQVAPMRPEAVSAYAGAANWVVTMFSLMGNRAIAGQAMQSLDRARSLTAMDPALGPQIEGLAKGAQAYFLRSFGCDPYLAAVTADEAIRLLTQVGDQRVAHSTVMGLSSLYTELGDWESGYHVLQGMRQPSGREGVNKMSAYAAAAYGALALAHSQDSKVHAQAFADAEEVLAFGVSSVFTGMVHCARARLFLAQAQPERAAAEAKLGFELCGPMPPYALDSQVQWIRALLALGHIDEAQREAEDAIQSFLRMPGLGYGEVELRYAVAQAREASGDRAAAAVMYTQAQDALELRASRIPDPTVRARYLSRFPHHAWLHAIPPATLP